MSQCAYCPTALGADGQYKHCLGETPKTPKSVSFGGKIMRKISVRFEQDDYKIIANNCVYYGCSLSEYIRSCVLKKPIRNQRKKSDILTNLNLIYNEIDVLKNQHFSDEKVLLKLDEISEKLENLL